MISARPSRWNALLLVLAVAAAASAQSPVWLWLAGLVLATLGLGHGAFDVDLGGRPSVRFVASYVAAAVVMLGMWQVSSGLALFVFIGASVWHFGKAELVHLAPHRGLWFGYLSRGFLLVALPLFMHSSEVAPVIAELGVSLTLPDSLDSGLALLCVAQHVVWLLVSLRGLDRYRELLAVAPAVLFLTTLPLLVGFALTFALGHSVAHVCGVARSRPDAGAMLRAGACWLLSLLGGVALAVALGLTDSSAQRWASVFMLLSALTMPHMLVVERWHRAGS
jgi:Brp/Blh family beta-carotene 15,15'-monooxygenase